MPNNIQIYITATPDPEAGDVNFMIGEIRTGASVPQPTDAELIDIGNRLLASDYIQNRAWGSTAELIRISAAAERGIYPTP